MPQSCSALSEADVNHKRRPTTPHGRQTTAAFSLTKLTSLGKPGSDHALHRRIFCRVSLVDPQLTAVVFDAVWVFVLVHVVVVLLLLPSCARLRYLC